MLLVLALAANCVLAINEILLFDTDTKQHAISDYVGKGKWTVVNLWGVNCPPCREEMPELVMLHDEYSKSTITVLGIAIDYPSFGYPDQKKVSAFMGEFMIDFPVLLSDESISVKLGAGYLEGLPTTYIYTPGGKLVGLQTGAINRNIILDFIAQLEKSDVKKADHAPSE